MALSLFPKWSNIFPKSSDPAPRSQCESGSFGGVAVSLVLPDTVRCLVSSGGVACRGGAGGPEFEFLLNRPPKENVLPAAARRAPESGGGTGISWIRECGDAVSSDGISVEEGRVDEELRRVDVELSYVAPLCRFRVRRILRESKGRA
jgi:hypothetical protein